jgi:hypothetical protein
VFSINKPFNSGGGLSVGKPFDKGGTLSINVPFNSRKIGDAGRNVEKFVRKHPWETVAALAFIAGGAYLIIYEGYALEFAVGAKTFTIIAGAKVVADAGGSSKAAGAGSAVYTELRREPTDESTSTPPKPVVELPSPLPQLPDKATDIQIFDFCTESTSVVAHIRAAEFL